MKTYIVKRLKDKNYLAISESELSSVLNRETWNGSKFDKDFELVGEDKSSDVDMEALFGTP